MILKVERPLYGCTKRITLRSSEKSRILLKTFLKHNYFVMKLNDSKTISRENGVACPCDTSLMPALNPVPALRICLWVACFQDAIQLLFRNFIFCKRIEVATNHEPFHEENDLT